MSLWDKLIDFGQYLLIGLAIFLAFSLVCGIVVAVMSIVIARQNNEKWSAPALRWADKLFNYEPLAKYFGLVVEWFFQTDGQKLRKQLREIWEAQDERFEQDRAGITSREQLDELMEHREEQLKARAKERKDARDFSVGSVVVWVIAACTLPAVVAGSYYLKAQVAREFMIGSENLKKLQIAIGGLEPIQIGAVEIIVSVLVLFEIIFGVALHLSVDRQHQLKSSQHDDPVAWYKVMQWVSIMGILLLITVETMLGGFRGELEVGGDMYGRMWIMAASFLICSLTIMCSFLLKSQLKHAMGALAWIGRVIGFIILMFIIGPFFVMGFLGPKLLVPSCLAAFLWAAFAEWIVGVISRFASWSWQKTVAVWNWSKDWYTARRDAKAEREAQEVARKEKEAEAKLLQAQANLEQARAERENVQAHAEEERYRRASQPLPDTPDRMSEGKTLVPMDLAKRRSGSDPSNH